jgi:hypothetical protein
MAIDTRNLNNTDLWQRRGVTCLRESGETSATRDTVQWRTWLDCEIAGEDSQISVLMSTECVQGLKPVLRRQGKDD